MNQRHHGIAWAERNQHVTDLEPSAPDRIDHRMIGAGGGIGGREHGIGAQMPWQLERQLYARRKFRKTLVDAELEVERAVLMPEHDRRRHRRISGVKRDDFALAGVSESLCGAS